jgi:hypothetical protein
MRKWLVLGGALAVLVAAALISWRALCSDKPDYLAVGNLVVLSLTLVVLFWYAYDTNTMARVTQERWKREGVLSTTYSLELVGTKGDVGRTLVRLHNPSTLVVRARVAFNFKIYGEPVSAGGIYDGKEVWLLFPQQVIQGWFELEVLAQKKGKTVSNLIAESVASNRAEQLTAELEIEFWDELGSRRKLPTRHHYFDFDRWAWIPYITERGASA